MENHKDVYSAWNKSTFLHFQDGLEQMGKIILFSGTLSKGKRGSRSMESSATFYCDPFDLLPHLYDLLFRHTIALPETMYGGTIKDSGIVSRTLRIDKWDGKMPIIFEIRNGPGKKNGMGGIEPDGDPTGQVKVMLSLSDARHMAAKMLAQIDMWIAIGMPEGSGYKDNAQISQQPLVQEDVPHEFGVDEAQPEPHIINDDDPPIVKARKALVKMGTTDRLPDENMRRKYFALLGEFSKYFPHHTPDDLRTRMIKNLTADRTSSWKGLNYNEAQALIRALELMVEDQKKI